MSTQPTEDCYPPGTGLDELRAALATSDPVTHSRQLWQAVTSRRESAARIMARPGSPLWYAVRRAANPDAAARSCRWTANDLLAGLIRALVNAPITLTAMAAGSPSPVHGRERRALTYPVELAMVRAGIPADQVTARKLTYDAIAALGQALRDNTGSTVSTAITDRP